VSHARDRLTHQRRRQVRSWDPTARAGAHIIAARVWFAASPSSPFPSSWRGGMPLSTVSAVSLKSTASFAL